MMALPKQVMMVTTGRELLKAAMVVVVVVILRPVTWAVGGLGAGAAVVATVTMAVVREVVRGLVGGARGMEAVTGGAGGMVMEAMGIWGPHHRYLPAALLSKAGPCRCLPAWQSPSRTCCSSRGG